MIRCVKNNMPKILIFESEDMLRDMYVKKFRQVGFEVATYKTPGPDPVSIVLKGLIFKNQN